MSKSTNNKKKKNLPQKVNPYQSKFIYPKFQIALDVLCLAILVVFFIYLSNRWESIPDYIQIISGDTASEIYKGNILMLPCFAGLAFFVLTAVGFFSRYGDRAEDEEQRYLLKKRIRNFLAVVKLLLMLIFCAIAYFYLQGFTTPAGVVIAFVVLMIATIVYHNHATNKIYDM